MYHDLDTMSVERCPEAHQITQPDVEEYRKKTIRMYLSLSLVQFVSGVGLIGASFISLRYAAADHGVPYFVGGFLIGGLLMVSSLLSLRVYNRGPSYSICDIAKQEVICAVNWHRMTSFFLFVGCIAGLSIIWMYGVCYESDLGCSYSFHRTANKIIANISLVLGIVGLITGAAGLYIIRQFGLAFGLLLAPQNRNGSGLLWNNIGYWRRAASTNSAGQRRTNDVSSVQQRDWEIQRQQQLQVDPFSLPQGGQQAHTNLGFELPDPPQYSPSQSQYNTNSPGVNESVDFPNASVTHRNMPMLPKYSSSSVSTIPAEPPPPYTEKADETTENSRDTS